MSSRIRLLVSVVLAVLLSAALVNAQSVTVWDWQTGRYNNYSVNTFGNHTSIYDWQTHTFSSATRYGGHTST